MAIVDSCAKRFTALGWETLHFNVYSTNAKVAARSSSIASTISCL